MANTKKSLVVGAGAVDIGLITVRGGSEIQRVDVIVYPSLRKRDSVPKSNFLSVSPKNGVHLFVSALNFTQFHNHSVRLACQCLLACVV